MAVSQEYVNTYSTGRNAIVLYIHRPSARTAGSPADSVVALHVEYAGGGINYVILFIFSPFYEYSNLEYVHIHVIYRVIQTEYVIRILVAVSQEYVNTYSTRRVVADVLLQCVPLRLTTPETRCDNHRVEAISR